MALVHRPKYDDWSWPKGKLDPGEDWTAAAVRETEEETGLRVRLGRPLPASRYRLDRGDRKEVRYWAAQVVGGDGLLQHEIDEVRWVTAARARKLLTHERDVDQLRALVTGPVPARPLVVVRHAHALPRKKWTEDDRLRPLDASGVSRAPVVSTILGAYGTRHVITSPSTRCVDTVAPYERDHDVRSTLSVPLSEEGFTEDPAALSDVVDLALRDDEPVALCSHGPVLGPLLDEISRRCRIPGKPVKRVLHAVRRDNLDKGEVLVLHLGDGPRPAILAVERHRP